MFPALLLHLLFFRTISGFVYSCSEISFHLINREFEQYSKYAYVIIEEDFSNWELLDRIFLSAGNMNNSFTKIARSQEDGDEPDRLENNSEVEPWQVTGNKTGFNCDSEFTLILTSDESDIVKPYADKSIDSISVNATTFVVPRVGMAIFSVSQSGEGNVTVYTGSGTGEEEERFELYSWPCGSTPDIIVSMENVITIQADRSCSYYIYHQSDIETEIALSTESVVAVLISGRSDDYQNQSGMQKTVVFTFSICIEAFFNMALNFDSANTGYVGLQPSYEGAVEEFCERSSSLMSTYSFRYTNGTHTRLLYTDYFNVQWAPYGMRATDVGNNEDNVVIEITTTASTTTTEALTAAGTPEKTTSSAESLVTTTANGSEKLEETTASEKEMPQTTRSTTTSTPAATTSHKREALPTWAIVCIVIGAVLVIGCTIGVIIVARRQILSLRAEIVEVKIESGKKGSDEVAHNALSLRYYELPGKASQWEIERSSVYIDYSQKLGEGAFGSVFLGRVLAENIPTGIGRTLAELSVLKNSSNCVAVKMLHESSDKIKEASFGAEIELMKRLGYHERIVNLLAAVTLSTPILLISEYCSNGDLLEFMRRRRLFMFEHPNDTSDKVITARKQLMFAIQIAYGLEYLASHGFIHRDIAARNIMVDAQETCKIGDFGLCREVETEDANYQTQGGKLPLKWMSPEAVEDYTFSSASDVWSFGILLFEIVTLGGTPYAGWPFSKLLTRLKRGERMEKPDNCSEEMYEVMTRCWDAEPSERPTSSDLRKRLGELLEDVSHSYYLNLNAHANYYEVEIYCGDSQSSSTSELA